jgi:hypothetical protein
MANFNLQDYETVEERIKRFYNDNPSGRILTELMEHDPSKGVWVVKAEVYLGFNQDSKATGWAFEIDGQGMANKTSALENAETSAIGRALANAGYSGNKRATREEMQKVAKNTPSKPLTMNTDDAEWLKQLDAVDTLEGARELYKTAQKSASQKVLAAITLKADTLK